MYVRLRVRRQRPQTLGRKTVMTGMVWEGWSNKDQRRTFFADDDGVNGQAGWAFYFVLVSSEG
jgi:hypothetical protein